MGAPAQRLGTWDMTREAITVGFDAGEIALALDEAVTAVIEQRVAHPTESADLLNVLFSADGGTWPRKRVRDEALTLMLAGHEITANAMSWFWYLLALHPESRDRMLDELDEVLGLGGPAPTTCPGCRGPRHVFRRRSGTSRRCGSSPAKVDLPSVRRRASHLHRAELRADGDGVDRGHHGRRFRFDLQPGHPVDLEATLTLRPKYGVRVVGRRREAPRCPITTP